MTGPQTAVWLAWLVIAAVGFGLTTRAENDVPPSSTSFVVSPDSSTPLTLSEVVG